MTKNEKLFKKYKSNFSFLLNDKYLTELSDKHFDKNKIFVVFLIALLENRIDKKRVRTHLKINKDEWSELFITFYKDQTVLELFKKLEINPIVPLEQIIKSFDCFVPFIDHFISFVRQHELNLNIHESKIKDLLLNVFGYLLYSNIDCQIPYHIQDILLDADYDTKYAIILNNTKLFSNAKKAIITNCGQQINDLIVLLLGMNKKLNKGE